MNTISEFEAFLENCKDEQNHHQQNVKNTYEKGFKPLFDRYRKGITETSKHISVELRGLTEFSIDDEEAFFILAYTGSYSSWLNDNLRNGLPLNTNCKKYFATRLCEALDKLPSYNNNIVFRMDNPSGEKKTILSWFGNNIGKTIKTPYFLSTSKDNYGNTEIVWKIKTLNANSFGKDLDLLTNNKIEKEVLFKCNAHFAIQDVDMKIGIIEMQEVLEQDNYIELTRLYFEQ